MVEVHGIIQNQYVSILIDPCSSLSYVSPSIVEKCNLSLKKFEKSLLVQLTTRTKRKVVNYVENYNLLMSQFEILVKLNVLPLGSYDVLIGMDWMKKHQVILNFFQKTFTCLNNEGERVTAIGIPRKIFVRKISSL